MTTLKEGQKAPAFTGVNQQGQKVSLAQYAGKKLILYFYPKDMTPTCTVQACNLRDDYASLKKKGWQILGISPDDENRHQKFIKKNDLPFDLIADTDHKIITKYGVWGQKQLYGRQYMGLFRTTFLIDEKGVIKKIIAKPKSKQHSTEILTAWKEVEK